MALAFAPLGELVNREHERDLLASLLQAVEKGQSRALVVRGEPGVGKSALLDELARLGSRHQMSRLVAVQSEMELPFAGLHRLCTSALDKIDRLPSPQREAIAVAFGMSSGEAPNRFIVGLAVLSLLSEAAREGPYICLVDDAQWLDRVSAQTLAFVARRLLAESIALVLAVREPSSDRDFVGLPELRLGGLARHHARALLERATPGRLDERIRDRIVAETRGNPLAILELPRGLTPEDLAGGFGLPSSEALASRIEDTFVRRLRQLSGGARQMVLLAALESVGDASVLWRAAAGLGLEPDDIAPAEAVGLIDIDGAIHFRHPLVRRAAYRAASHQERRAAHAALADATDAAADPDRSAWHRGQAIVIPDEAVARALEQSADRAGSRGGVAAAAAFLARATDLTPDPSERGRRALAAAQAKFESAATETVEDLLAIAERSPLDRLQEGRLRRLRAELVFTRQRGTEAAGLLLEAASKLEELDPRLAADTYVDAFAAALYAGRLGGAVGGREIAIAFRRFGGVGVQRQTTDALVEGLATYFIDGSVAASPMLAPALHAIVELREHRADELRWLWLTNPLAFELWDDQAWYRLTDRAVKVARRDGALASLRVALAYRAGSHVVEGEFASASVLLEESDSISIAAGVVPVSQYARQLLAAWRGDEALFLDLARSSRNHARTRGEGRLLALIGHTTALLYNGHGRYEAALAAAAEGCDYDDLGIFGQSLAELIEAAVHSGARERALNAVRLLEERTRAVGTDWGLGVLARSRALLTEGAAAEAYYREAIERLGAARVKVHLARAHLVFGEWLRRENRRAAARDQLRTAYETFAAMGAEAFADRARRELVATGETVRKRGAHTIDVLTAQEYQVARLAAAGHTNSEIGSQLFMSPRTAEYHLHKVYAKLGITSRRSLRHALEAVPVFPTPG